jgi:hypothetical protein
VANKKRWLLVIAGLLTVALAYFGYTRWQKSQLAKALHDPDPVVRMDAVRKAGQKGHGNLLLEALRDEDPDIRFVAASSIGPLGSRDSEKVRALLMLYSDDHAYVWKEALHTLRYATPEARPFIYKAAADENAQIRAAAAYALVYVPRLGEMGRIAPPPRPPNEKEIVVSHMTWLLKDDNVEVRKAASFCLFGYPFNGEEAERIRSALNEAPLEVDQDARDLSSRLKKAAEQQTAR